MIRIFEIFNFHACDCKKLQKIVNIYGLIDKTFFRIANSADPDQTDIPLEQLV